MIRYSALLIALMLPTSTMADITGQATVIDGDTLQIGRAKVRLHGIDAPESRQFCQRDGVNYRCGQQAANVLSNLIGRQPVLCKEKDTDRYGRVVAQCFVSNTNLNDTMVRQGWAIAYRQYSRDYIRAEEIARRGRRGIWAGTFQTPADWRQGQKSPQKENALESGLKPICQAFDLWICP